MSTTANAAAIAESIGSKLQYVFKGLKWLHSKATRFLLIQLGITSAIVGTYLFTGGSVYAISPYIAISLITVGICGFLFMLTQSAAEIEDNLDEIKESLVGSQEHIADTKEDVSNKKFSVKSILKQANFVANLSDLKDLSIDAKDGIMSLAKVFTPFTGTLFLAAALTTFLQLFALMIALIVFIF